MSARTFAALSILPLLFFDVPAIFGQADPLHPANPRTERVFAGGRPIAVETAPDGSTSGSPVVLSVSVTARS
jgi:hypothetical protein